MNELDESLVAGDAALHAGSIPAALELFQDAYRLGLRALAASGPTTIDDARRDLLRCQDRLASCFEELGEIGPAAFAANAALELAVVLRESDLDIARRRAKLRALNADLGIDGPYEPPVPTLVPAIETPSPFRVVRVDVPMRFDIKIDGVAVTDDAMPAKLAELAEEVPPVALEISVEGDRLAIGATSMVVEAARHAAFNRVTLLLARGKAPASREHVMELGEGDRISSTLIAADQALQAGAMRVVLMFG